MPTKRAAAITALFAAVGLFIAGVITSVHHQLAATPVYTSFCNVNERVNCDVVLTSDYAYLFGIPVAWLALAAYLGMLGAALAAAWAPRASQRRQAATLLFAGAIGSVIFSLYLAYVSFFDLQTICLLCSGLYVVNLGLLASTAMLFAAARAAAREQAAWQSRTRVIAAVVAVTVVALLAVVGWKANGGGESAAPDPGFLEWYKQLPVVAVDASGGHVKGSEQGSVTMVEFSDFECGHCGRAYKTLKSVLPRFHNDVQLRFHHFPLDPTCNPLIKQPMHKYACLAAMAAECAGAQGKFWEYHDMLFEHQTALERDSLLLYADQVGLDRAAFLACLDSDAPRQAIARDIAEATRLKIESTPTFYLNGRVLAGAPDPAKLEAAIRVERAAHTSANNSRS
jgi:protein-disulfide isomerase